MIIILILLLLGALFLVFILSNATIDFTEKEINVSNGKVMTYSYIKGSEYLLIFESGLANDHSIWLQSGILTELSKSFDILVYDRVGYGKSSPPNNIRNIQNLTEDLSKVIQRFGTNKKIILIGHSWGGPIIRNYAIANPSGVYGLIFIDPSHERYNSPLTQENNYFTILSLRTFPIISRRIVLFSLSKKL